jgi:CheY-like chemotaxis protein
VTYAIILGIMAAILGVTAYPLFSIGHLEKRLHDLKLDEEDVTAKIDALDSTRTNLERDQKDVLSEVNKLDIQKDQLVLGVQKFGATPVEEPSLDPPIAAVSVTVARSDASGGGASLEAYPEVPEDVEIADEAVGEESGEPETPVDDAGTEDARPHVLIVDDNGDLRDLLSESFSEDYLVDRAADGLEALNYILKEKRRYDAIITDLNMPNLDGLTFLANVPAGMRVIVMSAYLDRPEFEAAATHERVFCTIEKPFKLATIREAVIRLVAENPKPVEVEEISGPSEQPSS